MFSLMLDRTTRQSCNHTNIYTCTIILLINMSACRRYQTAGRNYCSIVSGDVSNCSYRLKALSLATPVSQFGLDFFPAEQGHLNGDGGQWVCLCTYARECACVCVRACMRARVRACVRACVCACVRVCVRASLVASIVGDPDIQNVR